MLHRKSVLPFFITVITLHPSSSSSLPCISPSPLHSYFSSPTHPSYVCPFYYLLALFNFFTIFIRPASFSFVPPYPPRTFSTQSYLSLSHILPAIPLQIWLWSGQHWFNSLQEHGLCTKAISRHAWATSHLPHQWLSRPHSPRVE